MPCRAPASFVAFQGGLYVIAHVYERDFDKCEADPAEKGKSNWMALIDRLRVKAFPELTVAREGLLHRMNF